MALLALVGLGCAGHVDPATASDVPETVKEVIRQSVDHGHRSGVFLGLVNTAGVHTFSYPTSAAGEGAPSLDAETVFAVGSVTKVFTGLLLAEMVERGELELDAPVNRYLPAALSMPVVEGGEMTLRHLVTHTSGLPREPAGGSWEGLAGDGVLRRARAFDFSRPFGDGYEYSNLGMAVLGRVMELRAGKALPRLFGERLAGPLGLTASGYEPSSEVAGRLAPAHAGAEALPAAALAVPPAAFAAGGLYATGADLLRLVAAGIAPSQAGPLAPALRRSREVHAATDEAEVQAGLGWKVYTGGGHRVVHHGGQSSGHQAFIGFDAEAGVGVVLLADSRSDDALDRVALHLLAREVPLPDFSHPREVMLPREILEAYAGRYRLEADGGNGIALTVRDGRLVYRETTPGGKEVRETTIYASGEGHFYFTDIPVTLAVQEGPDGSVGLVLSLPDEDFTARRVD